MEVALEALCHPANAVLRLSSEASRSALDHGSINTQQKSHCQSSLNYVKSSLATVVYRNCEHFVLGWISRACLLYFFVNITIFSHNIIWRDKCISYKDCCSLKNASCISVLSTWINISPKNERYVNLCVSLTVVPELMETEKVLERWWDPCWQTSKRLAAGETTW